MKPHLIALDLDGTLLNDDKTISEKNIAALKQAEVEGHHIMIATGRPYRSSEIYYRQLGLKTPIVNFNGAFVHHPNDRSWKTVHETIDLSVAQEVIEAMQDFNLQNIVAEVLDDVYLHYHDERLLKIFSPGSSNVQEGDLRQLLQVNPTSLLIQGGEGMADPIRKHLEDIHAEFIEHRRWGAPWEVVEVIRQGLHKAVGLSQVSKWMDIPQERIIAFGDEDNDLEMIEYAGVGVAMGNGIDRLKSIANEVTTTNNDDGVAVMLRERLNLKNS